MHKTLKIIQILSLDVVTGSMAIGYLAVRLLDVSPNAWWWIILPMSVWTIYSVDHLFDGYKLRSKGKIERHNYYFRNRFILIPIIVLLSFSSLVLSFLYLETRIIIGGLILGLLCTVYFLIINFTRITFRRTVPKELVIAFIYATGIFLAPFVWGIDTINPTSVFVFIIIGLLAFSEGVMISYFDFDLDLADGHSSFTTSFGRNQTRRFLLVLHLIIEISLLIALFKSEINLFFICFILLLIMNFILAMLTMVTPGRYILKYHKLIGESVFLLPAILWFF